MNKEWSVTALGGENVNENGKSIESDLKALNAIAKKTPSQ